jgi:formate transporter
MADEETRLDALLPPAMARRAEEAGVRKVATAPASLFALAVLAGAFIALGGVFATTALAGAGSAPWGPTRVLAGLVFSLGLILVVVGGAELFTGNNLIVMAWAGRRVTTRALVKSWAIVYAGNVVGAAGTALLVFLSSSIGSGMTRGARRRSPSRLRRCGSASARRSCSVSSATPSSASRCG